MTKKTDHCEPSLAAPTLSFPWHSLPREAAPASSLSGAAGGGSRSHHPTEEREPAAAPPPHPPQAADPGAEGREAARRSALPPAAGAVTQRPGRAAAARHRQLEMAPFLRRPPPARPLRACGAGTPRGARPPAPGKAPRPRCGAALPSSADGSCGALRPGPCPRPPRGKPSPAAGQAPSLLPLPLPSATGGWQAAGDAPPPLAVRGSPGRACRGGTSPRRLARSAAGYGAVAPLRGPPLGPLPPQPAPQGRRAGAARGAGRALAGIPAGRGSARPAQAPRPGGAAGAALTGPAPGAPGEGRAAARLDARPPRSGNGRGKVSPVLAPSLPPSPRTHTHPPPAFAGG